MKNANDVFTEFLKKKGLQLTQQRRLIVGELMKVNRHVSVEELYDLVKRKEESIGQVTVFRTLKLLVEADIARPVNLGDKTVRYEAHYGVEHHDHLVCTSCGRVIEALDRDLETLKDRLCEKFDFVPVRHRLEIFGTCRECRE